jgi:hypothetical protein
VVGAADKGSFRQFRWFPRGHLVVFRVSEGVTWAVFGDEGVTWGLFWRSERVTSIGRRGSFGVEHPEPKLPLEELYRIKQIVINRILTRVARRSAGA